MLKIIQKLDFKIIRYILVWFIVTRLLLTLIGTLSYNNFQYLARPDLPQYSKYLVLNMWGKWDTEWYLNIAEHGYTINTETYIQTGQSNIAFFPLFPILIGGLEKIIGDYFISGLVIANFSFLIACYLIYSLAKNEFGENFAKKTLIYIFLFPAGFVLSGAYVEPLFLMLSVLTFFLAKKQYWWRAGFCGFLLVLSKSLGIFIIPALIFLYLKNINFDFKKIKLNIISAILPIFGLVIFALYCYSLTGDLFAFMNVHKAWNNSISYLNPLKFIISAITSGYFWPTVNAICGILIFALFVSNYKKLPKEYFIFSLLILYTYISCIGLYFSIMRYTSGIFTLYFCLAWLDQKNPKISTYLPSFFVVLQCILMSLWVLSIRAII